MKSSSLLLMSFCLVFLLNFTTSNAQVLPERDRADMRDAILKDRFDNVLPKLMAENDIDMWLVIAREYNEDPVMKTMLPATWLNARRRTILVFYHNKTTNTTERLAVARYNVGENITSAWDPEKQPKQWARLLELIEERDPKTIGINVSEYFGIGDGLVKTDYTELMDILPSKYQDRIVSAEKLVIGWIETRTSKEMDLYNQLVDITSGIIDEAFSTAVITPGVTTTDDVVWWMRQKVTDLGLETWFHPTIDIQRNDKELKSQHESFTKAENAEVIIPGDLLHCDFGITYITLNTDCQRHAYVLKEDETEVPDYLKKAFEDGNRIQDIFTSNFKVGRTGNEVLAMSLAQGKEAGLRPAIYSHPLGNYGHSAGTTLGMWDSQGGVPISGDYPLHENTVYAIELNTTVNIPEWNKDIRIMLEEAGFLGPNGFRYVNGRQKEIKVIR